MRYALFLLVCLACGSEPTTECKTRRTATVAPVEIQPERVSVKADDPYFRCPHFARPGVEAHAEWRYGLGGQIVEARCVADY